MLMTVITTMLVILVGDGNHCDRDSCIMIAIV